MLVRDFNRTYREIIIYFRKSADMLKHVFKSKYLKASISQPINPKHIPNVNKHSPGIEPRNTSYVLTTQPRGWFASATLLLNLGKIN